MTDNHIVDTADMADMAEVLGYGTDEPTGQESDIVATRTPEGKGIEFTVSMRSYTQRDMESLIVEAAARVLVGEYGDAKLAKLIEQRCIELTTAQADKVLAGVTAEIMDQPMTPKWPGVADPKPVTMRDFIGLTGQAYLTETVDYAGNASTRDAYGRSQTRMQFLVSQTMSRAHKDAIEKATNAAISEVHQAIRAQHEAFLTAEKARFKEALAKAMAS